MVSDLVQRAKELACRAHAGQVDKAGRPYIEHVARVAAAVAHFGWHVEVVAWLHDVLEDCRGPEFDEVFQRFPGFVAMSCMALNRKGWATEREYYSEVRRDPIALRVKLADIADNADESRLALLPPDVAARLRRKYAKARQALTGEVGR